MAVYGNIGAGKTTFINMQKGAVHLNEDLTSVLPLFRPFYANINGFYGGGLKKENVN